MHNLFILINAFAVCLCSEDIPPMSGFYTDGLDKVEIVYPEKVSKDGSFVSYYLPHYYNIDSSERPRRTPGVYPGSAKDAIHFFIPIEGEKHHLELWPNVNFISPELVVERRDARDIDNVNKAKISHISQRQCHYNGQIVGKTNSSAALSTCYGLAGYIRIPAGDEYLIEPVKDSKPTPNKEHPHIIYKRSSIKDKHGSSNCRTKGRAKESLEERMQWEALFGDKVRKEMSGININQIMQDSNKAMASELSNENIPSPNSAGKENSETGENVKEHNENKLDEKITKTLNEPQSSESNNQKIHYFPPLTNERSDGNGLALNEKLNLENKLKRNQFKGETKIKSVQFPEINSGPSKTLLTKMDEDNQDQGLKNLEGKKVNDVNFEHGRIKREINNDLNDVDVDKKENQNKIDSKFDISNNIKDENPSKEKQVKCCKKIHQRNIATVSSSKADGIQDHSSSNNSLEKQPQNSKKEHNKLSQAKKLNVAQGKNKERVVVVFKEKSDSDKSKKSNKIKREELKQNANEYDTNKDSNGQSNESNLDELKVPNKFDASGKIVSAQKEKDFQFRKENNVKREIHLDTSEKSWQLSEKSDKSKLTPDNTDKKKINPGESTKLQENIAEDESVKQSMKEEETDKTKELDSSKLFKIDKENLNDDENIMSSVVETIVDDINKLKVKKDVSVNNILSSVKSENKLNPQDLRILKSQENVNEMSPENNQKIYVLNSNSAQNKDRLIVSNQKLPLSNKEPSHSVVKSEGPPTGHSVQDITTKNSDNGNEIIIRIKAPDNTITGVKQTFKSDIGKMKKENIILTDIANDSKGKGVTVSVQNNQPNVNPINPIIIEKNKRGALSNEFPKDQKIDLQNTNADAEIQQQMNNEDNDQIKREDTIHVLIETEPEINHAYNSEANAPKPNLFCQGKNCLEIKPVVLNESNIAPNAPAIVPGSNIAPAIVSGPNIAPVATNNLPTISNISTDMPQTKLLKKRDTGNEETTGAFEECSAESTTLKPLLCFDLFNRLFNLELMITVDYKVVKMHENDDVENFILTIVNMVSTNFYDKSVGINLSVMLIRLILLTTCIKELDSDQFNPEELLENFCTWQVLVNPGKDDHPHHHDLAIFVTRMDKCEGQVMGVTYMTSICRPDKSCLVCIDEGLLLANTITHQIGHSFGAEHDDGQSSGCSSTAPDGTSYHMAPTIRETSYSWSVCSRDAIVQFIKTQGSWCLGDQPSERTFNFPLILPGQIYSAAQQCRLNFHMTALPCAIGAFCDKLYCQVTEKLCATKGDPPADGTFCAADMWCFHKDCVHIGRRPGAVNGEWGPWTEWSVCTRSCGGGVSSSYRICNNPKPSHGGRYCVGNRMRHRMCATKPCEGFTESFRDLQCKKTEDKPFKGVLSNWAQYHSFFMNIECALVCQNRKGNIVMRSPIVADGTPCKAGTRNVCIQGVCRNVGCDWVIDSYAKEDACGMCHGNGTECKIIQGVFDEATNQRGMVEFLRVPKRSGMVFIRETVPSPNVLAVSGAINRVFYLNGQGNEEAMPGDVSFGATHGVYEVRSGMERIFIRGPIAEELLFYVFFKEPNKGIHYQFAVPDIDPTYVPRYLWQYLDWDPCTDPCSGGSQRAQPKCVEDRGGVVDDNYCPASLKPSDIIRPCNSFPCQAKWWVSVWSDCICMGQSSLMFRSVLCLRSTDESGTRSEIVKESECANHKKPRSQKPCNETEETNQNCLIKRDVHNDEMFRSHRDMRRAINPKTAYVLSPENVDESKLLPDKINDLNENKINNNINQKKAAKSQDTKMTNVKGALNKYKSKQTDKDPDQYDNKKKTVMLKNKVIDPQMLPGVSYGNGDEKEKQHLIMEEMPPASESLKQIAKLKSLSAFEGASDKINQADFSKQGWDSDLDSNCGPSSTESSSSGGQCDSTTSEVTNATITCKAISEILPHEKTTCCKTSPHIFNHSRTQETTTLHPISSFRDDLDTSFALTVVPVDPAIKHPQSDNEFMYLGNIGLYHILDEDNGTIISGQQAIDFLENARRNATGEPVILHEDSDLGT